jgi:hypothetical protein
MFDGDQKNIMHPVVFLAMLAEGASMLYHPRIRRVQEWSSLFFPINKCEEAFG